MVTQPILENISFICVCSKPSGEELTLDSGRIMMRQKLSYFYANNFGRIWLPSNWIKSSMAGAGSIELIWFYRRTISACCSAFLSLSSWCRLLSKYRSWRFSMYLAFFCCISWPLPITSLTSSAFVATRLLKSFSVCVDLDSARVKFVFAYERRRNESI